MTKNPPSFDTLITEESIFFNEIKKVIDKNPNAKLLDIGCGSGGFAELLTMSFPSIQYFGLDIEKGNIDLCMSNKNIADSHKFICEDFHNYENNQHFDIVISYSTLQLIDDSEKVF